MPTNFQVSPTTYVFSGGVGGERKDVENSAQFRKTVDRNTHDTAIKNHFV